ncbi:MAG: M50 family metallopeptidase [Pseudonocardia sp.]
MNAPFTAGDPVVWLTGAGVLAFVLLASSWAGLLVTVAHEGGHMTLAVLTGRNHGGFTVADNADGATKIKDGSWGAGDLLTTVAGYLTPPLLGLGGAALLVRGQAWSVVWAATFLLAVAAWYARNGLATAVCVLGAAGAGYVAWTGGPELRVGVALAMVWLLLIGGARDTLTLSRGDGSDPYWLARRTWIPRIAWQGLFVFVAGLCLWFGGRSLLGV